MTIPFDSMRRASGERYSRKPRFHRTRADDRNVFFSRYSRPPPRKCAFVCVVIVVVVITHHSSSRSPRASTGFKNNNGSGVARSVPRRGDVRFDVEKVTRRRSRWTSASWNRARRRETRRRVTHVRTLLVLFESRLVGWCITTIMHDARDVN